MIVACCFCSDFGVLRHSLLCCTFTNMMPPCDVVSKKLILNSIWSEHLSLNSQRPATAYYLHIIIIYTYTISNQSLVWELSRFHRQIRPMYISIDVMFYICNTDRLRSLWQILSPNSVIVFSQDVTMAMLVYNILNRIYAVPQYWMYNSKKIAGIEKAIDQCFHQTKMQHSACSIHNMLYSVPVYTYIHYRQYRLYQHAQCTLHKNRSM